MKELLFEAYNRSSEFVAEQILYLEGIEVHPDEEHMKQNTLHALRKLLKCALVEECNEFNREKHEAEHCYE
jgi:hypothetical protein